MLKSLSSRLVSRAGASAIFVVATSLSNVAVSQAMSITPDSVNPWQHIVDCWGAMVAGDPVHATDCSPGQPGSNTTLVTPVPGGGSGGPPCTPISLAKPTFETYQVASLDDSIAPSKAATNGIGNQIAGTLCGCPVRGLPFESPVFSTNLLASLDDSIMPPRSLTTEQWLKLAQPVKCE